jgi:hypothetical protein
MTSDASSNVRYSRNIVLSVISAVEGEDWPSSPPMPALQQPPPSSYPWHEQEGELLTTLQGIPITTVEDFARVLALIPSMWWLERKEWPNVYNFYCGLVYYRVQWSCHTSLSPSEREFPSQQKLWETFLGTPGAHKSALNYISLFILGWNDARYKYFKGRSLLPMAAKIMLVLKASSPPRHFNMSPHLSEPPPCTSAAVQVLASRVHGWGLFASKPFVNGDTILCMKGKRMLEDEFHLRYPPGKRPVYVVRSRCDPSSYLELHGAGKYLNEPPQGLPPNAAIEETDAVPGGASHGVVYLVAKASIVAGQELLALYCKI